MIHETKIRQRIAGKRKRIQLDPNLKQGYPNKREEVTMPDDLYKKHDDAVPDKIHVDAEKRKS